MENVSKECVLGAIHEEQIKDLIKAYDLLVKDVKEIKERLLGRPSWTVCIVITFLSTLAFSALTFAFTMLKEGMVR